MQDQVTRTPAVSLSVSFVKYGTGGIYLIEQNWFIIVPHGDVGDQLVDRSTKEPTDFKNALRG